MNKFRSSLFLMEMIIVIFFFSLSAAVCLQIFTKAHTIGKRTEEMSDAVLWAENCGELFYEYGDEFTEKTKDIFDMVPDGYETTFITDRDEDFLYLTFSYVNSKENRTVYTVSFKQHIKEVME